MPQDLTTLLSKFLQDLYGGTFGVSVPVATFAVGDGLITAPSMKFASQVLGFYRPGANAIAISNSGFSTSNAATVFSNNGIVLPNNLAYGFSATASATTAPDSGITRVGAASLALGTATPGDFSGTLKLTTINAVTSYQANGVAGVATFGPSAVASITVKQGIITAIS